MATTPNYSFQLPQVGGNQDAWGSLLNSNWTALDTLLGGVTSTEISYLDGLTANVQTQIDNIVAIPAGVITMWSGSIANIPSGWYLCDGNNGTPNLTGKFIVHADADSGGTYAPGDTGGANTVALSEAEMPSHTHTFSGTTNTTGAHTHTVTTLGASSSVRAENVAAGSLSSYTNTTSSAGDHSHTFSGTTSSTGSGSAHENRPPYYALAYIMKA